MIRHHKKPALAFRTPPDPDAFVYGDDAASGAGAYAPPIAMPPELPSAQAPERSSVQSPAPLSVQVPEAPHLQIVPAAFAAAKRKTVVRSDGRELRRLGLYIPVDVHRALATRCAADDIDVSDFVSAVLRERLVV